MNPKLVRYIYTIAGIAIIIVSPESVLLLLSNPSVQPVPTIEQPGMINNNSLNLVN